MKNYFTRVTRACSATPSDLTRTRDDSMD